jgi:hypothetical protein
LVSDADDLLLLYDSELELALFDRLVDWKLLALELASDHGFPVASVAI